jgi:hypothetical protein
MMASVRRQPLLFVIAFLMTVARLDAHDVVVEQPVRMVVAPQDGRLIVRVRVPETLLNDAGLPTLEDGSLDASVSDARLQVVGADVIRNLDFRQGETGLKVISAGVALEPDRRSVDVEISYALDGPPVHLSARFNAFQGTPLLPPRTDVSYQPGSPRAQAMSVTGPPVRVTLDPGVSDVVARFGGLAFDVALAGGSHLLFLVCLLIPMRRPLESIRFVVTLLAAQAIGIILAVMLSLSPATNGVLGVAMTAWSFVVISAIGGIVGSGLATVGILCGVFGLLSGVEFGASFAGVRQFAGAHGSIAFAAFAVIALAAESWLAGVIWATRRWLKTIWASDTLVGVVVLALAAHLALHRVLEGGVALALTAGFAAQHAVVLLVVGWTTVMVGVALSRFLRGAPMVDDRRASSGATP